MTDKDTSTVKSYADSAVAAGQSLLGSITGNPVDKNQAANKRSTAQAEHDASHSVGKLGPIAVSPSGGVSADHPDRTEGSYNQTIGAAKEAIGNAVGADGLRKEGQRQNAEGKGQEAEGQLRDYGTGIGERVKGGIGGAVAGALGDREGEERARQRHDDGKTAQRSAEHDIIRQNQ